MRTCDSHIVQRGVRSREVTQCHKEASRGFEPRSLDSESRVLTVTPRGQVARRRFAAFAQSPNKRERRKKQNKQDVARSDAKAKTMVSLLAFRKIAKQNCQQMPVNACGLPKTRTTRDPSDRCGIRPRSQWSAVTSPDAWEKGTHRGARTHDHKVKSLALCRLS